MEALCDPFNVAALCIGCLCLGAAIGALIGAAIVWDMRPRICVIKEFEHD